jgi:hypothetical protein
MKLSRLEAGDFDRIVAGLKRMGDDARQMARAVLVNQRPLPEVALEHSVTKQRVHLAVETVRKRYAQTNEECGFMNMEIELPHLLAQSLDQFAKALESQTDPAARHAAIVKLSRALSSAEHALE